MLCIFIVCIMFILKTQSQGSSITFLPDVPLCIGEEVEIICFVIPPAGTSFADTSALISLNMSPPVLIANFNSVTSLGGVDTTRYTADVTGLTISTSRPGVRVTISDYQATDGNVLFGCGGLFSDGSTSDVLISDSPQSLAAPPSPPDSLTADYNPQICSGAVQLAWTPGASDRDIEMYFLSLNGVQIASLGPVTSYTHTITLQRDMEYTYSVVAMSCAGSSTETPATSISLGTPCQETGTCFTDTDGDGYPDTQVFCDFLNTLCVDNCPLVSNPDQSDCTANGVGDVCDITCLPERDTAFGYNWTCTEGGQTVSQTCIGGAGSATRVCSQNGDWSSIVNTSLCFSAAFNEIRQNISIDSLGILVEIFKNGTTPTTVGDISVIVAVLDTTIEATTNVTGEEVEAILNNTLIVVDILADDSSQTLLTQSQEDTQVSLKVLNVLEMQASNLALSSQNNVKLNTSKNVFIETQTVDVSRNEDIVINANNILEETEGTPTVRVPIPEGLDSSQSLSVSVVVMKNIGKLIQEFSDDITVGASAIKLNHFADFEIVSSLIALQLFSGNELLTTDGSNTLAQLSIPLSLSSIDLTRRYIKPTCLFLGNASSSNPNWEDSGIQNVSSDDIVNGVLTCLPGHNTAFVVLVGVGNLESQTVVLNILSYVGCSLSVVCLLISMIIYLIFGRNLLRKIYHFVHFKLALSLCLLYLAFLFGVEPAYANVWLYIPCKIVTVVVEYLLLVTFLWMLMEGIVVLIMIMWPFHQFNWKHFVIFSCISWGLPLIYVIPFIPFFHQYYLSPPNHLNNSLLTSTAEYCFIHNDEDTNLIYSVTAPLAVIIFMNFVILSIVIVRCVLLIVKQKSLSKLQRTQKTALRLLRLLLVMFPVLGFGWSFGLLAIYFNTTVFAWLFTIFCAFQGILFLFFVLLLRRDVQRSIVKMLDLKSKYLTLYSSISNYYSKPVSTKATSVVTKQTFLVDHTMETLDPRLHSPTAVNADISGRLPPPTELAKMWKFFDERKHSRIDSDMRSEMDKGGSEHISKISQEISMS